MVSAITLSKKGPPMASTFTKTLFVVATLTAATFTTSAHANSFNKFPVQNAAQAVSGLQNSGFDAQTKTASTTYTNTRTKRVVKPVPGTQTLGLSYASDMGTVNRATGFNKMKSSKFSSARAMPVVVSNGAFSAR